MMETVNGRYSLQQDQYSPHINRVLKSYRSSAMDSLSGPREFAHFKRESNVNDDGCLKQKGTSCALPKPVTPVHVPKTVPEKRTCEQPSEVSGTKTSSDSDSPRDSSPRPPRVQFPLPILSAPDQVWGEVSETCLEGETISCFSVGGEKRLCLPQVLNSVLRGVGISQIHGVCDELHIFCSTCSKEQLDVLKKSGILPPSASQCGLITKTDAERLCSELLNVSAPQLLKTDYEVCTPKQRLEVHHKCFGKCRGMVRMELYSSRPARCIECSECHGLFAPAKFVSHTHDNRETRTVHWGFDSSQWRSYLLLCSDQAVLEAKEALFKEFKNKFDATLKRKQSPSDDVSEEKRCRLEETAPPGTLLYPAGLLDPALLYRYYSWPYVAASLPRVAPPPPPPASQAAPAHTASKELIYTQPRSVLSHDPPVLLHPDRVVKTDQAKQHERHFQPNVALAPHNAAAAAAAAAKERCSAEVLADVEATVARVATLVAPLPPAGQEAVLETVRTLALAVTRLRAESKQKTTLLEERTAHLHDLMVNQQKEAARRPLLDSQDCHADKPAALDCRLDSTSRSGEPSPASSTAASASPGVAGAE